MHIKSENNLINTEKRASNTVILKTILFDELFNDQKWECYFEKMEIMTNM